MQEAQDRVIGFLNILLRNYRDQTLVISSHGTLLSVMIHYFDSDYGFQNFKLMKHLMPWIVKFVFSNEKCILIESYDVFQSVKHVLWSGN
ncbi:histidine phosphatase family protein [Sporolactobacillus sp. Y61]|uniref:Histidine phosphatase family protein n=1 Tax=Sporolactobacillus sp. Y61 TaxID=3160863 RepID=A0AAU8IJQ2_9BACL